jgi:outer membrane immunogenic protein
MNGGLTHIPPNIPLTPFDFANTKATIDFYGTARGRLGFNVGQWMFFGTAGAAYGSVSLNSTYGTLGLQTMTQSTDLKVGYVAGAGFEYMVKPNVMLTFNYQYVDLGRTGIASSTSGFVDGFSVTLNQAATTRAQFQTATVGLSWRFAPDSSPAPWAGGYIGAQGGGAWGNSASAVYNSFIDFTQ